MPELYGPFEGKPNVHQRVVEAETERWVADLGLLTEGPAPRLAGGEIAVRSALAYPLCDAEGLRLANDWCTWLLAWDAQRDRAALGARPEQLSYVEARFLDVLAGAVPGPAPLDRALADLRSRMLRRRPGSWFRHFRGAVRDYFAACVWEASNRQRRAVPDQETYLAARLASGAVLTTFELFAVTDGADLPDAVRADACFLALQRAANHVICLTNDVLSLDRVIEEGDVHNLVIVLMTYERFSREDALFEVACMHDDEVVHYLRLERSLPSFGAVADAAVERHCRLMRAWMFANRAFSAQTRGYPGQRS
jgi:5-epi-alpha-selinene synthase